MSTGMVESWAGKIADIGPIYPFVGSEFILWIIGLVLWIGWHIWHARHETKEYADEVKRYGNPENYKKATSKDD